MRFFTASRRAKQVEQAQPNHITSNEMRLLSMRPKRGLDQPSTFRRTVRLASAILSHLLSFEIHQKIQSSAPSRPKTRIFLTTFNYKELSSTSKFIHFALLANHFFQSFAGKTGELCSLAPGSAPRGLSIRFSARTGTRAVCPCFYATGLYRNLSYSWLRSGRLTSAARRWLRPETDTPRRLLHSTWSWSCPPHPLFGRART